MPEKYAINLTDRREKNKYYIQIVIEDNKPTIEVVGQEHLGTIKSKRNIGLEDISVDKL